MLSIEDRIAQIEAKYAADIAAVTVHCTNLEKTIAELRQSVHETTTTRAVDTLIPPRAPGDARAPTHQFRPAQPKNYSGARDEGRDFFTSCELYMSLLRSSFEDEARRVGFVLSYMQEGRASIWRSRYLRQLDADEAYSKWERFTTEFQRNFFPVNEAMDARNLLESVRYHQGRRSVREFIDDFHLLLHRAGYEGDNLQNVMRFRRGLAPDIQNGIAESPAGTPGEADLAGWVAAAERLDLNRQANAAFRFGFSLSTKAPQGTPFQRQALPPRTHTPIAAPLPPRAPFIPPSKPLAMGTPMEVDTTKRQGTLPPICYRCHKPGHMKRECPQRFDIRFLSPQEFTELVGDVTQGKDQGEVIAAIEGDPLEPPEVAETTETEVQDFSEGRV